MVPGGGGVFCSEMLPEPGVWQRVLVLRLVFVFLVASALGFIPQTRSAEIRMAAHCVNVGQGDATLLEFPCGAVLVDAGAQDEDAADHLLNYLDQFFQRRSDLSRTLEAVYITHPHRDHTFALRRVMETFQVRRLIENGQDFGSGISAVRWARSRAASGHMTLRPVLNSEIMKDGNRVGLHDDSVDPLRCETCDPRITILSGQWDQNPGWPSEEFKNNNNHSLVIRVEFGESSFLFSGDLEVDAIKSFLSYYELDDTPSDVLDADVYHVGHHGSHNATTRGWLSAMSPTIAVISCGRWDYGKGTQNPFTTWAYGHPRRATVQLLAQSISGKRSEPVLANLATGTKRFFPVLIRQRIYATAWDGDTVIHASLNNAFSVSRSK
jgi:competence protein ComEC